jgi:hypothetical protein
VHLVASPSGTLLMGVARASPAPCETQDIYVFPSPPPVRQLMLAAFEASTSSPPPPRDLARDLAALEERMSFGDELGAPCSASTHKTEFRAQLPPRELNFARRGAEEVACFARVVSRMGPTAAAALSPKFFSATSLHVHVNVRREDSAGELLSATELLRVWAEWVRFDAVTMRFGRPWVWREPWCAPMFATGAEFAMDEAAWEQGGRAFADEGANHQYDVPAFVEGVAAALASDEWAALETEAERVAFLFDPSRTLTLTLTLTLT